MPRFVVPSASCEEAFGQASNSCGKALSDARCPRRSVERRQRSWALNVSSSASKTAGPPRRRADDRRDRGVQDAEGTSWSANLRHDDDSVSGVVATLVAHRHVHVTRHEVGQLPFTFVAHWVPTTTVRAWAPPSRLVAREAYFTKNAGPTYDFLGRDVHSVVSSHSAVWRPVTGSREFAPGFDELGDRVLNRTRSRRC